MQHLHLILAAGALCAAALPLGAQTPGQRPDARALVGSLGAPEGGSGLEEGTADNFGRRVDGDGSLMIVADDLTASILDVDAVAFETTDLLSLVTIPNFTGVLDVALEGNNAVVFVERSNGTEGGLLYRFRRILVGPDPVWLAAGNADPVADADLVPVYAASESLGYLFNFSGALGSPGTGFGASVAIGGRELFVGEPTNSSAAPNGGAVRAFDIFLGTDLGTLTSSTPAANDAFGRSLALSPDGTLLAIGERNSDAIPSALDTGYVRLADRSGGTLTLRDDTFGFGAPASGPDEDFGVDMAWADDGSLFLGAPGSDTLDGYVAWFFYDKAFPWMETNQSPALAGSGGVEPELRLEGAAFTDGPLVIGVRDALPGSITFAIIGLSTLNLPAKGGTVYPSLTILKTFPVDAQGQFIVPTTWTADLSSAGAIDLFFQFWVQDPGGPAGFSASDGGVIHHY